MNSIMLFLLFYCFILAIEVGIIAGKIYTYNLFTQVMQFIFFLQWCYPHTSMKRRESISLQYLNAINYFEECEIHH